MSKTRKKCSSSYHTGKYIIRNGIKYEKIIETEIKISAKLIEQYEKARQIIYAFDEFYRNKVNKKEEKWYKK